MKIFIIIACTLILGGGSPANDSENPGGNGIPAGRSSNFSNAKVFKSSILSLMTSDSTVLKDAYIADTKYISAKVLKDFQARFDDASEVMWYSDGNGFTSYFTKDGFRDRAYYNKNGRWQYSLIYYAKDRLPSNILAIIKSGNADFDIDIVVEMQSDYGKAYVVYMGNKSDLRILKVNEEGEVQTIMKMARG